MKKTAAVLTAGIMAFSCFGLESFAQPVGNDVGSVKTTVAFGASVAKPTYKVKGAKGYRRIQLSTSTSGADIYYTTNGKRPSTSSKLYTPGTFIKITKDTKICAIAVKGAAISSVMTKTFKVATKYGDVTGDGNINQTDYSRLKSYFDGETDFIVRDNSDCNGSGGLSQKDLTVLGQYLNGKIDSLPNQGLATLKTPTIKITSTYGGKSVTLSSSTSGVSFYYTLDGSNPTTSSNKYNSSIWIDQSCTLKVMTYKDGNQSSVRSVDIPIGVSPNVTANYATNTTYNSTLTVALSCGSDSSARIYYTDDGTDPRASATKKLYSNNGVTLTKDTTIKAYAQTKGCVDGAVTTYDYRINAAFSISGYVWDDTPTTTASSNGMRATNEPGIGGITVYLVNSSIDPINAPNDYLKKTTTNNNGEYSFTDLTKGGAYRVVFEYNSMKYRSNNTEINDGNQAVIVSTPSEIKITNSGAYTTQYNIDSLYANINSYNDAVKNSKYNLLCATKKYYTDTTTNVNCALISKNYGVLEAKLEVSGHDRSNNIGVNDTVTYTITLTNNSPMSSISLMDVELNFYATEVFNGRFEVKGTSNFVGVIDRGTLSNGYRHTIITGIQSYSGIAPGKSVSVTLTNTINRDGVNKKLSAFVEVSSYKFSIPCYDYYSIPGNLTIGTVKEKDEATTTVLNVVDSTDSSSSSSSSSKSISALIKEAKLSNYDLEKKALIVHCKNCTSKNDVIIGAFSDDGIIYFDNIEYVKDGSDLFIYFDIGSYDYDGTVKFTVYLASNTSKYVTLSVTVRSDY